MRGRVVSEIIITTMTNSDMLLDTSLLDQAWTDFWYLVHCRNQY